jgi:hypothetical protein
MAQLTPGSVSSASVNRQPLRDVRMQIVDLKCIQATAGGVTSERWRCVV